MTRMARSFVSTAAVADEVVQDTWLAVIQGLDKFESRSSLKTWIFRILVNRARTRGVREQRTTPFSSVVGEEGDRPAVDPACRGLRGAWHLRGKPACAPAPRAGPCTRPD